MTGSDIVHLQKEVVSLQQELASVKTELAAGKFTKTVMCHNDEKVLYYTELPPFLLLFSMLSLFKEHVSHSSRNVLTQFEELVMFFMQMRLAIHLQDLAYRFKVSQPTTYRICEKWLDVCYDHLSSLVCWPEKEDVMRTMTVSFIENLRIERIEN